MFDFIFSAQWHLWKEREYSGVHARVKEIRKERYMSRQEWVQIQNRNLFSMLAYVGNNVPYYKDLFKINGLNFSNNVELETFRKIPLLEKNIIKAQFDKLISENVMLAELTENATGGSTGTPVKFYQDFEYKKHFIAADTVMKEWWGIRPYDRTGAVWGADQEFKDLSLKERFYQHRSRIRTMNAFRMKEDTLKEFCMMLRRWKPPYLIGYSSALEALAKSARKYDISDLRFKAIRSSAEMLWPHQRQLIEDVFQSPVYNTYGSREINCLAAECPEKRQMHLLSSWRLIEVTDETGCPVPEGEAGYIVVTDLSNFGMPFIRYRNEDMGRLSTEPCPCGRPTPVLLELLGRSTDLILSPKGGIIHGEFFTHLFYGRNEIRKFQILQVSIDQIILRYVPEGSVPESFLKDIVMKIQEQMGVEVKVDLQECKDIPTSSSGKHRFTISCIK